MFRNVKVPILGIIENMSSYVCPNCGHSEHIFGQDGVQRTAEELHMDVLGQVQVLHSVLPVQMSRVYYFHKIAGNDGL